MKIKGRGKCDKKTLIRYSQDKRCPCTTVHRKKKELCGLIDKIEAEKKEQTKEYDHQTELWESATELNTLTKSFAGEEKLSRKMVMAFVDNVYVYDPKRIEVVFRYEDVIEKLIKSLE